MIYGRYHSLHHTQFRTNYSLFMPIYDYIYGTVDKSSDALYESSLKRQEESPDIVYLTHLTTTNSIYHLRLGFASLASKPFASKWYLMAMWPVTCWSVFFTWIYGRTFISERNAFYKLKLQSWVVPRYTMHVIETCFSSLFFFLLDLSSLVVYGNCWDFFLLESCWIVTLSI